MYEYDFSESGKKKKSRKPIDVYSRALMILASRRQTETELRRKLITRGHSAEEVEETLDHLRDLRYLDDALAAKDWAKEMARVGGYGRSRAIQKLIARGINPDSAREEVASVWDDALELEHAIKVRDKILRVNPTLCNEIKGRNKLWRSLISKGFKSDIVKELVNENSYENFDSRDKDV
jgi:regulatory protein